ncbi:MolT family ABC transporter permease [Alcaligenes faecalis subsp. faecalis NCIB 8687]|nr:MolT family ABC transporter permease [Alcaligenes faecalis subsp. faecalis NCIB 8687]
MLTSFAASDVLLQQIINGAPVDVFASADQKAMNKAEQAKVLDPATRKLVTVKLDCEVPGFTGDLRIVGRDMN